MPVILETRLNCIGDARTQASIRLSMEGWSFTVSGILIRRDQNGQWRTTMPLCAFGESKHPAVTLQGTLKEAVLRALFTDHLAVRESGQKTAHIRHVLSPDLSLELGSEQTA